MVLCMGLEALDLHIALHIRDARGLGPSCNNNGMGASAGSGARHNVQHAVVATVAGGTFRSNHDGLAADGDRNMAS